MGKKNKVYSPSRSASLGATSSLVADCNREIDESHQFIAMMRFIAFSECNEIGSGLFVRREEKKAPISTPPENNQRRIKD